MGSYKKYSDKFKRDVLAMVTAETCRLPTFAQFPAQRREGFLLVGREDAHIGDDGFNMCR